MHVDSKVRIETIGFAAHNPGALVMLIEDGTAPILTPEWVRAKGTSSLADGRNHPVALVASQLGGLLVVEATFSVVDATQTSAKIRPQLASTSRAMFAAAFTLPNDPVTVTFVNGTGRGTWHFHIAPHGVELGELAIQWREVVPDGTSGGTHRIGIDVTVHEVAITLDVPDAPWWPGIGPNKNYSGLTKPWWDVVRRACLFATGATTPDAIATLITGAVNRRHLGGVYWWQPSNDYTSWPGLIDPPFFDCAGFLRLLRGEAVPSRIDCADTTAIVLTFANAIGARLSPCFIGTTDSETRPVTVLGWAHAGAQQFAQHEFAVGVSGTGAPAVWDACLTLGDPVAGPTMQPSGIDQMAYLGGLLPTTRPKLVCEPNARFRPIGPAPLDLPVVTLDGALAPFADYYHFDEWRGSELPANPGKDTRTPRVRRRNSDPARLVAVDLYTSPSVPAARLRLLALLARMHPAGMRRVEPSAPGVDVEFRSETSGIIAATAGTATALFRSAGPRTSLSDVGEYYEWFPSRMDDLFRDAPTRDRDRPR
jgi:hypothetical protein